LAQSTVQMAPVSELEPIQNAANPETAREPKSFVEMVELFGERKEVALRGQLYHNVHLVAFEPGRLEIRPTEQAPRDLPGQVVKYLREWFGPHWNVLVSGGDGDPTLVEQARVAALAEHETAARDPIVKAVLETFPGARIARVTARDDGLSGEGLTDPFEDEDDDDDDG